MPRSGIRPAEGRSEGKAENDYRYFLSVVAFFLFVIPEGNLRFARITKATSGGEPL